MRRSRSVRALLGALPLTAVLAAPALAVPPARPALTLPKVESYAAKLDVAGYVDIDWQEDTRANCAPGVYVRQTERFDFETGRPSSVRFSAVKIPGEPMAIQTSFTRRVGSATVTSRVRAWQTTNYCPPLARAPEPAQPACRDLRGKVRAWISLGELPRDDGDLAPLPPSLNLNVMRSGGGNQDPDCRRFGPTLDALTPGGVADTAPMGDVTALTVKSGLWGSTLRRLKRGRALRTTITIDGPCEGAKSRARAAALESCTIKGRIVVSFRRNR